MNMVGESGSGGDVTADDGDGTDGGDDADVSREHPLSETMENAATAAAAVAAVAAAVAATTTGARRIFDTEDNQAAFAVGDDNAPSSIGSAYCGQPAMPRWHSPHVGAIGSEI